MRLTEKILEGTVAWPCDFLTAITYKNELWIITNYYHLEMIGTRKIKTYIGFHP